MRPVCLLPLLAPLLVCLQTADAATFTVTSLNDNSDANAGDGTCADAGAVCSFRAALEEANALGGTDTIEFNISGSGPHTAEPASAFPTITEAIVIDGTTEPDWTSGTPVVELDGSSTPGNTTGLVISAGSSTIRGLIINGFSKNTIHLQTNGGNTIEGCWLGVDDDGVSSADQTLGLLIDDVPNNTIGGTTAATRNVIAGTSGNGSGHGIEISGSSAANNVIQGNYIGVDATGATALANSHHGISITGGGDDNTIGGTTSGAGNVISGNSSAGINIEVGSDGTVIQGNHIGTNATGDSPIPNEEGILLSGTTDTSIGGTSTAARNIISGNNSTGILGSETAETVIQGNYIGTNASGTSAIANEGDGGIDFASDSQNLTIGGTASGAGNLISGNDNDGIRIDGDASGSTIQGNYIGVDVNGTSALANGDDGIDLTAEGVTIGGTSSAARNIISGNSQDGISITGTAAGSSVLGNYVGVDVNGTAAIGNGSQGIDLSSEDVTIGGTASGAGNLVGGNTGSGISVSQDNTTVQGNFVGTNASGDDLGNGSDGIPVSRGPSSIGGTATDAGNTIAFNGGHGVVLYDSPSEVQILGNSIHSNDGMGIDLNEDGSVQANDAGDTDTGYNGLQNFPVLSTATLGSTIIDGSLNSAASATFRLEFFSNSSCDGSGNGEGETYLGTLDVTTDGSGDVTFTATLSTTANLGEWITATATDGSDNTSEFSACVEVTGLTAPTLVAFSGGTASGHTPTLDWSDVSGATSYTLEYADNASFTSSTTVSGLTSSEYTFPTSLADDTYYWRVKASDGSSESDNSSADSFAIIPLFHPGVLLALIAAMVGWLRWRSVRLS